MPNLYTATAGIGRMETLAADDSPVHRLSSATKLITSFAYIVAVISFPSSDISGLMPYLFYPFLLMAIAGIPVSTLFSRLLIALPFSLMGGFSNLFVLREPAFVLGGLSFSVGAVSFASIMLKTLLSVLAVLILVATTPFTEICAALARLKVPGILCLQLLMTYRYVTVLLGEAVRTMTAYRLRAPLHKGIQLPHMGSFLGNLLLRSMDRAERVYRAMLCRGFQGDFAQFAAKPRSSEARGIPVSLIYGLILTGMIVLFRIIPLSRLIGIAATSLIR